MRGNQVDRPIGFVGSGVGHRKNSLCRLMGASVELLWSYIGARREANLGKIITG